MVDVWVGKKPRLIEKDYKTIYKEPAKCVEGSLSSTGAVFKGTGAYKKDHPHMGFIPEWAIVCGKCKNDNPLILYTHWVVNIHSGDAYWDVEVFCEKCKRFTLRAYAEND